MSKIPMYAHYYMTEKEIEDLHKVEIHEAFLRKGYDGLASFERDWFVKYFPELIPEKER